MVGSLSAMPSKGICFLSFEMIKNLIAKDRKLTNTELLVAGAAAGAITEVRGFLLCSSPAAASLERSLGMPWFIAHPS